MKIDFQQSFSAVQRLINARATAAYRSLDQTRSTNSQDFEIKAQLAEKPKVFERPEMPPAPALIAPKIDLGSISSAVKLEASSVKAPTVLSVEKLIDDEENLNDQRAALKRTDSPQTSEFAKLSAANLSLDSDLSAIITEAGASSGVDPALGIAVATAESSLNPNAISSDGHASKGLFQLLDRTGIELHQENGGDAEGYNPFEPNLNVKLGMRYLRKLHEYFSTPTEIAGIGTTVPAANSSSLEKLAVAAFNAGEGRVTSAQNRAAKGGYDPSRYEQVAQFLPDSTQSYVTKVISLKESVDGVSRLEKEKT